MTTSPPPGFRYIDAHTHLHPQRLFRAIRRWFDEHSDWTLESPTEPEVVARFLACRGVERFVFFSYAHKAGISRDLNPWLHETAARAPERPRARHRARRRPRPALRRRRGARRLWLQGLKFHIHVQRFHPDDPRMLPVYQRLVAAAASS